MTVETFTSPGLAFWTPPDGVTSATVELKAAGAAGAAMSSFGTVPGGGGGGGEYASSAISCTPGVPITYTIGTKGSTASAAGGNTTWNATEIVAIGGGSPSNATGGTGGTGGTGTTKHAGANGGTATGSGFQGGAGGGSSGGSAAVGNVGSANSGATGGAGGSAPTDGGAGGAGATNDAESPTNAVAGTSGGGGGGAGGGAFAAGGDGWVRVTYTAPLIGTAGVATAAITGVSPSGSGSGSSATATPGVATVVVSGASPASHGSGSLTRTPDAGTVAITATSPSTTISGTGKGTPDAGVVALSGISPASSGSGTATATPGVGTVAITGTSPIGSFVTSDVVITGVSPASHGTGTASVSPGAGVVALSGITPYPLTPFTVYSAGDYHYYESFVSGPGTGESGCYRVANDIAGYVVYIGIDGPPDFSAAPTFSATLPISVPVLPPGTGLREFHVVVRKRNQYGLESQNQLPTIITINSTGDFFRPPVPYPQRVNANPKKNSTIRITAKYASIEHDQFPATRWRFWISAGVIDPAVDTPTREVNASPMAAEDFTGWSPGTYNVVVGLYRAIDGALAYVTTTVTMPEPLDPPISVGPSYPH